MLRVSADVLAAGDAERVLADALGQLVEPERCLARIRAILAAPALESHDVLRFTDGRVYERYSAPQRLGEEIVGRVWSHRDVTERVRAEEALRRSEATYRSLYENTPAMMHSIDRAGHIVSVSRTWLAVLGYDEAEVLGRRSIDFLAPESRRYAEEVVLPAFYRTGACRDVPYRMVRKDGSSRPSATASPTIFAPPSGPSASTPASSTRRPVIVSTRRPSRRWPACAPSRPTWAASWRTSSRSRA
jgi:PAS domain S-box-containing protein